MEEEEAADEKVARGLRRRYSVWIALDEIPPDHLPWNSSVHTDFLLISGAGVWWGWQLKETAAAVATFQLLDGTDANGELIYDQAVGASGRNSIFNIRPIRFRRGLYVHWLAAQGTLVGVVYLTPLTRD